MLTDNDYSPAWSPDGTKVAFGKQDGGGYALYTVNAHGGSVTRITTLPNGLGNADWSPDGTKLAFDTYGFQTGTDDVYAVDMGSKQVKRLTGPQSDDTTPSWSPDSQRIAFLGLAIPDNYTYESGIRVMNADGTNDHVISYNSSKPVWSPDGSKILFEDFHLYVMDADGSNQAQISTAYAYSMDWQPIPKCTIRGTEGDDRLPGTAGKDVICGGGGNDTLLGASGNDILLGGIGNDTLIGGTGNDTLNGGSGTDRVSYSNSGSAVKASLTTGFTTGEGSDVLLVMENATGSNFSDGLSGSSGQNVLVGGKGKDTLTGLAGDDILNSRDSVNGNDSLDGGPGTDRCVTDQREAVIRSCP